MQPSYKILKYIPLLFLVITVACICNSCKVDPIPDQNNPIPEVIAQNATLGEIQNLVDGTESGMRDNIGFYFDDVGVIGREIYRYSTSDPRFTSDLLGKGTATLDNNTFYLTNPYGARYRVVKNTNILIPALQNSPEPTITDDQRRAGIAYAKTIQAYELLMVFNLLYDSIRVEVADPDHLGPFISKDESLNAIQELLNTANADLESNPATFPFHSSLYSNTAMGFSKFNRAIAARVAVYRNDWAQANTALTGSFLDLSGSLTDGSYYLYSTAGGDQLNPQYFPLNNNGEARVVQKDFVPEAEAGDTRVTSKTSLRTDTAFQDGLASAYDLNRYPLNTSPIPIIRNEELILLYAEVQAQLTNPVNAVDAINTIRNAAGLPDYGGATDLPSLITEILKQRRYSLFGEGHRWIDLRRYDRLAELPIDRAGDDVWEQFPRPANE
jgi:hypothetical protein